jgi:CRP-like cAMP-binding protein
MDNASLRNRILSALPLSEYERLSRHLTEISLPLGQIIYPPEARIKYVYFVTSGVISLVANLKDGGTVEVGVVGNEGMVGLSVVLGDDISPNLAIVQMAGVAMRMKADVLKEELKRDGQLRALLLRSTLVMIKQISQTAACNRSHTVSKRLARWLLMCHDRVAGDELGLTQEFISQMLGIRRSGVSEAAILLQTRDLISYSRGRISILNRKGLERFACECYGIVRVESDRLLANTSFTGASSRRAAGSAPSQPF